MPINIMELMQPVYQTILAAYTQPPIEGLPPGNREGDIFITLNWPGQEIDERQYGNAWSPQNPSGSQDAVENITLLTDAIPILNPRHEWSGNSVETLYGQVLNASPIRTAAPVKSVSGGGPLAPQSERASLPAAAADTSAFMKEIGRTAEVSTKTEAGQTITLISASDDAFKEAELEAAYADAAASLNAKRLQFNLSDPAQLRQWEAAAPGYEAAVKAAWAALDSHRRRQQLKTTAETPASPGGEVTRARAQAGVQILSRDDDDGGGVNEPPPDPVLQAFMRARGVFDGARLASAKNPRLSYHPTYVTPANFADPEAAKLWPSIQIIPTQIRANSGATNSQVSFKFTRVNFIRPWLTMSLLKLSGWRVQGMGPGYLSNGRSEDNDGEFALLPTAMIVVRDLSITPVGTNAASADSYSILTSKGLQILAWINKVVPFSPPAR